MIMHRIIWIPKDQRIKPPWVKGTRPWVLVGYLVPIPDMQNQHEGAKPTETT